jgi:lipopolysaccharide heptosyltransferase II
VDDSAPRHAPARRAAWAAARNLLVVRPDNLGDVVMTSPALRAIRESSPQARITLLASPGGSAAALHMPMIDDVITADVPWVRNSRYEARERSGNLADAAAADRHLVDTLAQRGFDAAIVFTVYTQSALPAALLCHLAGIPLRLAYCRENPYLLLTDWAQEREPQELSRHEVVRQLDLVGHVGFHTEDLRLCFEYLPIEAASARRKLHRAGMDPERPYVLMHPGATAASRRWPAADFGRVAAQLAHDLQVVFAAGAAELPLLEEALAQVPAGTAFPVVSVGSGLGLGEFAATVNDASLVVCNNSAPAHLAAARSTPVVVLYALTNPQHTPWRVPARVLFHDVPCRNCYRSSCPEKHHRCLRGVTPEQAVAAARDLLARLGSSRPVDAAGSAQQPLNESLSA